MSEKSNPYAAPQAGVVRSDSTRVLSGNSPYGPMRNTQTLGRFVQGFLWVQLIAVIAFAVFSIYIGLEASREVDVLFQRDGVRLTPLNQVYTAVALVTGGAFFVTVILFCTWTNKSMKNAWAMREDSLLPKMTPAWAVGFYFIPFMMLWKPFQGMKEIWLVTFQRSRETKLLGWWWTFWLLGNFADNIGRRIPVNTFSELSVSCLYDGVTSLFTVVSAFLLIRIVAQVTKKQMEVFHQVS